MTLSHGHYEVKVDGEWIPVPNDKINNVVAPDGGAHFCAPRQEGANKGAARRIPDIGCWAPLSSIRTPKVGVVISLYLSRSTAGYFMSRSQSTRAARVALSTVCV